MDNDLTLPSCAMLAFHGMEDYLEDELRQRLCYKGSITRLGSLFCLYDTPPSPLPYWASTVMLHPQIAHFSSIKEAANILRSIQRNWASAPHTLFRRTQLIQDALPHINTKPRPFPTAIPISAMGLFTLLDKNTMLFSAQTTSPFPCGILSFTEDHINPPSRAYLKLQEAFTAASYFLSSPIPCKGSRCFDAGASPGGWTWVLVNLGCTVFAVDRAPLAPSLMQSPLVTFTAHDAFTISPEEAGEYDWVLSDVACYPERLLQWVKKWVSSGLSHNMICTIKVQGKIDYNIINEFAALPNSKVLHLNANKHELTLLLRI